MEKEFVSYKLAVKLKELGFDEPCIAFYEPDNTEVMFVGVLQRYNNPSLLHVKDFCAPTFSQTFRWFRKNYTHIKFNFGQSYWKGEYIDFFDLTIRNKEINRTIGVGGFTSYEEAELNCLEQLIEMVEQK
jgi:hypothetical protein